MAAQPPPRKMGDFTRPSVGVTTTAIVLSTEARNYELKQNFMNQLPSFYGMPNEDALLFIREFSTVVQTFPLHNLAEEQLMLKCFPYTLKDRAKSWYLSLPARSVTTWSDMSTKFLLKYYPNHKTQEIRTQIMRFTQEIDEPIHEAWDRFQELLQQCPHHQLVPELLCQYFYDGLEKTYKFMVETRAGGSITDCTAAEIQDIFESLAASSQHTSSRTRKVEAKAVLHSPDLTKQLATMMKELQELKMSKAAPPVMNESEPHFCDICGEMGHSSDVCYRMGEFTYEGGAEVYVAQDIQPHQPAQQQPSGWRNPPNTGWRNQNSGQGSGQNMSIRRPQQFYPPQQQFYPPPQQFYQNQQPYYPQQNQYPMQQNQFQPSSQSSRQAAPPQKSSFEDNLSAFMQESKQAREAQDATIRRIENAMGQISGTVNQMQQQQQTGKIPSQAQQPHQAQAVTVLRSGRTVDNKVRNPSEVVDSPVDVQQRSEEKEREQPEVKLHKAANPYKPPVPYPGRLRNEKQEQQFTDFYKMLSKVNVNLPLLDVIRNVPAYVKFFKELASKKRKFVDNEQVMVSEVANSIMQQPLPPKQRDPGSFVIKIAMGNGKEATGMLDLGAGINLMPYSIFQQLELGELKPTRMSLQLADRSVRYPREIVEDILVCVGGLIVPVDFVVLKIGEVQENGRDHTLLK